MKPLNARDPRKLKHERKLRHFVGEESQADRANEKLRRNRAERVKDVRAALPEMTNNLWRNSTSDFI